jgi:hypothetical protein
MRFRLLDDSLGGSGRVLSPEFTTTTLVDAQVIAQQFSTMFGRTCRLTSVDGAFAPPWTPLYSPSSCRVLPSPTPQTVGW